MLLLVLFLIQTFCTNGYATKKTGFLIVTDRNLRELVRKDRLHTDMFKAMDDVDILGFYHMWDRFFQKQTVYSFDCENLFNSPSPISLELEGITDDNEVFFRFKLSYDLENIILSDFFDSNNIPIADAQFTSDENLNNLFVLCHEERNTLFIKNSLKYFCDSDLLLPDFKLILSNLIQFINNIENLIENGRNKGIDERLLSIASNAKHSMINITTTIIKGLSSLKVPILRKLDIIPNETTFVKQLDDIFVSLKVVVEAFIKSKLNNSDISYEKVNKYIRKKIISNNLFHQCTETYANLISNLTNLEQFVSNVVGSNFSNMEILDGCNVKKIDKFVETYLPLLISYRNIMNDCDNNLVFEYYYYKFGLSNFDKFILILDEFYLDKLIANRLEDILNNYKEDKTDLLVFTQTDYFKKILSLQIIRNIELIREINLNYNLIKETQGNISSNQDYQNHIVLVDRIWNSILKNDSGSVKTFKDLLDEEILPLGIYDKETFIEPDFILDDIRENKPINYSEKVIGRKNKDKNKQKNSKKSTTTDSEPWNPFLKYISLFALIIVPIIIILYIYIMKKKDDN